MYTYTYVLNPIVNIIWISQANETVRNGSSSVRHCSPKAAVRTAGTAPEAAFVIRQWQLSGSL